MPLDSPTKGMVLGRLVNDPNLTDDLAACQRIAPPVNIVLDFSGVTYLNSTHISLLITLRKHLLAHSRQLRLCDVPPRVWSVFEATGLNQLFDVSPDMQQAIAAIKPPKKNA